mgnify:CR=1 FL=1
MTQQHALQGYLLRLADSDMILGQRLSELVGKCPALEEELASTKVALDLIGQARNSYAYAAELIDAHRGKPIPDPRDFNRSIPGSVVSLLSRMTAKQPLRRPQSIRELIQKLLPLEVSAMKDERAVSGRVA